LTACSRSTAGFGENTYSCSALSNGWLTNFNVDARWSSMEEACSAGPFNVNYYAASCCEDGISACFDPNAPTAADLCSDKTKFMPDNDVYGECRSFMYTFLLSLLLFWCRFDSLGSPIRRFHLQCNVHHLA
jgi:hypothetical protein